MNSYIERDYLPQWYIVSTTREQAPCATAYLAPWHVAVWGCEKSKAINLWQVADVESRPFTVLTLEARGTTEETLMKPPRIDRESTQIRPRTFRRTLGIPLGEFVLISGGTLGEGRRSPGGDQGVPGASPGVLQGLVETPMRPNHPCAVRLQ